MKKLAIMLAFLMLVPGAAFGLEMMNDSSMDDVTGQSGVSIAVDDVAIYMNVDHMSWADTDGLATDSDDGGGRISVDGFELDVLTINAIVGSSDGTNDPVGLGSPEASKLDLKVDYSDSAVAAYNNTGGAAAISIDATDELPMISEAYQYNADLAGEPATNLAMGGVYITLPTVELDIGDFEFTPTFRAVTSDNELRNDLENDAAADIQSKNGNVLVNDGADYGSIKIEGVQMSILGGWMEIAPH